MSLALRALAVALAAGCAEPVCGPSSDRVDRVIDGDTIVLAGGATVRYLLVDTPEITGGHAACYGDQAAAFNADLVLGRTVELGYDRVCHDGYGRTLAYVSVDGRDVNHVLVERGYACVLHIPPNGDARAGEFSQVAAEARAQRRGLWGACDPIPCN
jgi:micrococcal nuclease